MAAGAAVWLATFALFLRRLLPGIGFADSGEMGVCSALLANTHAPGFPLQVLAGRLAFLAPLGSPAFRLNLLSAALSALAAVASFLLVRRVCARAGLGPAAALAGGLYAASALALGPTVTWISTVGEKYSMFLCAVAWCGYALARFWEGREARWGLLAAFLFGAALATHYQGIYLAVPLALVLWRMGGARPRAMALFLAALLPTMRLIYIPLRESSLATMRGGDWDNLAGLARCLGFLDYTDSFIVAGGQYREMLGARFLHFLAVMPWREYGAGLALAFAGAWFLGRRAGWAAAGAGLVFVTNLLLAFSYIARSIGRYELPGFWALSLLAGAGCGWLAGLVRLRGAAVLAAALLPLALNGWNGVPLGHPYAAPDRLRETLACAPPGSLLVCQEDVLSWYGAEVDPGSGLTLVWKGQVVRDNPMRAPLLGVAPSVLAGLDRYQEGSAFLWRLAELLSPRPVLAEFVSVPYPTEGVRWHGMFVRITRPGDRGPERGEGMPLVRAVRPRSLRAPEPEWEIVWALRLGKAFTGQARESLDGGRLAEAEECIRAGLRIVPDSADLHWLSGRAALARGRRADAEKGFARARALGYPEPIPPGAGGPGGADAARELYRLGKTELDLGHNHDAVRLWKEALARDPACPEALNGLGTAAFLEERFEDSAAFFDALARLMPRSLEVADQRRKAHDAIEWRARLPQVEARLAREAPSAPLLVDAGNAYWYLGRSKVAEDFYRRAIRLDPRSARAWGNLGSALAEQGRMREAVVAYGWAVKWDLGNASAMVNLGAVLLGMGDRAGAVGWLERALAVAPDDARARALLEAARGTAK